MNSDGTLQTLSFEGELTIYTAQDAKARLLEALAHASGVEIDLSAVTELDSAGLQLLLMAKMEAALAGKALVLKNHSPAVVEILDLCDLNRFFGDPVLISSSVGARA